MLRRGSGGGPPSTGSGTLAPLANSGAGSGVPPVPSIAPSLGAAPDPNKNDAVPTWTTGSEREHNRDPVPSRPWGRRMEGDVAATQSSGSARSRLSALRLQRFPPIGILRRPSPHASAIGKDEGRRFQA